MNNFTFDEFKKWLGYLKVQYNEVLSLLFILIFFFIFIVIPIHNGIRNDYHYEKYTYIFVYLIIIVHWLIWRYKYPRNKNNKTGLVIAIYARNKEELDTKNLFLNQLKKNFATSDLYKIFNVIDLKNHLAKNIKSNDDLESLHKKVKGHIYYFGEILKENDGDVEKYFITLDGYVKHMPIPTPVSRELSFDFRSVLPKEINFSTFFGLRGCRATANIAYLTTKYITGVASFLSGNPFLAYKLHEGLENEFSEYYAIDKNFKDIGALTTIDLKYLDKIKKKIPLIMSNECQIIASIYYKNNIFDQARFFLNLSLKYNPKNYSAWLLKAIIDFMADDNVMESIKSIKMAEKYSIGTYEWRYSKAFLMFWTEKYNEAWKECQKIMQARYENEEKTVEEIKHFNLSLLEKNPNKIQLYFWLGFTQYKKIHQLPNSLNYFETFVRKGNNVDFLIKKAQSYLVDIKKEMHI